MAAALQREHRDGQPTYLGDLFRVGKARGEKQLAAVSSSGPTRSDGKAAGNQRRPATVGSVPQPG